MQDFSDYFQKSNRNENNEGKSSASGKEYTREKAIDRLRREVELLNTDLFTFGISPLGDMFCIEPFQVELNLKTISQLIMQRKKDINFRSDIIDRTHKLESDRNIVFQKMDMLLTSKKDLETEVNVLKQKLKMTEKSNKEMIEKLNFEKEELSKSYVKLQNRENQYITEGRRKEMNFQKLQEELKKQQKEKNVQYQNNMICSALFPKIPANSTSENASEIFASSMSTSINKMVKELQEENEKLRGTLLNIHQVIIKVFKQRKESFLNDSQNSKPKDSKEAETLLKSVQYAQNINLFDLNKELFQIPLETGLKDVLQVVDENLRRVVEFFDKIEAGQIKKSQEKDDPTEEEPEDEFSLKNIKEARTLLRIYKETVERLYDILEKVYKLEELSCKASERHRKIEPKTFDNFKNFLTENEQAIEKKSQKMAQINSSMEKLTNRLKEEKDKIFAEKENRIALAAVNPVSFSSDLEAPDMIKFDQNQFFKEAHKIKDDPF